ncbi:hypothetical protein SAMN06296386_103130 [Lachnospiraceae bacterium]|nr:hypothetical protein SAMN06296386_103130 [Lachnospiraceae bacterium]
MSIEKIDARAVRQCFLFAANNLNANKERINELNVFPVPDGDTGTNMTMTITSAAKEVAALPETADMKTVCKGISMGSLRGARGNSGVILSQLLRGFTKVAQEHEELDAPVLAASFNKAVETAYKAVMKPKEGTILTVARGISEKANELAEDKSLSTEEFIVQVLQHGEYVLSQTPELLPVLKEAGVVDSGGAGLIEVIRGVLDCIQGKEISLDLEVSQTSAEPQGINRDAVANADIKFGYCTEFIVNLERVFNSKNEADFKAFLESIGDSIVCVAMEDIVKVHVHTNHPGRAFEEGLKYGYLTNMKVDNMREEHNERLFKLDGGKYQEIDGNSEGTVDKAEEPEIPMEKKEFGFITVSVGEGLTEVFKGLGADVVISGGQTMNPSTEDILDAVEKVNADTIFVLPNNKNIILAASQAADLSEDKKVIVIPSKSIPQGITAMINFIPDHSAEENRQEMTDALQTVKTGEVTYAVRDTEIDGHTIHSGDIMGIGDHAILAVGQEINNTVKEMVEAMVDEDSELITLYYGDQVTEEKAEVLAGLLGEAYPDVEIEVQEGGQPIYYYIVSVE